MEETWKDIPCYEGFYQVSNLGRVKSLRRLDALGKQVKERILKDGIASNGYRMVVLLKKGQEHSFTVHGLVAKAFLNEVPNKTCINHIDGDKTNNRVENLEWCTYSENTKHAIKLGLFTHEHCKGSRHPKWRGGITMSSKTGEVIMEFDTSTDAAKWIRENTKYAKAVARTIGAVCRGERFTVYGYKFRYAK